MIRLKTTSKHDVPFNRMYINTEVYIRVTSLALDGAGVGIEGYYYVFSENREYVLNYIDMTPISWKNVAFIENTLPNFNNSYFEQAVKERLAQFALFVLQQEGDVKNYGIPSEAWSVCV